MDARLTAYFDRLATSSRDGRAPDLLAGTVWPGASFFAQLRAIGVLRRLGAVVGLRLLETMLLVLSWVFVGSVALSGRTDRGWLMAWALCLVTIVPVHAASRWWEGVAALGWGGLLKERLLAGAVAMDADWIRRKGTGELLSEVLETDAIDRFSMSGGLDVLFALLELVVALVVLTWGAAGLLESAVLVIWAALMFLVMARSAGLRRTWTDHRMQLTRHTVEQMLAHRTRVAQQRPSEWHRQEDVEHERYADVSLSVDRSVGWIEGVMPRAYVAVAFAALSPTFLSGSNNSSLPQLAIALAAILFAGDAFRRLSSGFTRAAAAWTAWRVARPMFDAAAQGGDDSPDDTVARLVTWPEQPVDSGPQGGRQTQDPSVVKILHAESVVFTHEDRLEPTVRGGTLTVDRGDFVLLEGESGGGKSTFASLIGGLRRPSAGVVLAAGLDLPSLGAAGWRRHVILDPQYHENHMMSAPLGFNLLLGRRYPHSARDLEEARAVCEDLGLGPLIDRMPAGLDQMVGEGGWQLSQGERSRVFLARALLQHPDLLVLDESLAALDPVTLHGCLDCLFKRANALVLIAHP
jgi:ATP-binding cassette subfamily B protein